MKRFIFIWLLILTATARGAVEFAFSDGMGLTSVTATNGGWNFITNGVPRWSQSSSSGGQWFGLQGYASNCSMAGVSWTHAGNTSYASNQYLAFGIRYGTNAVNGMDATISVTNVFTNVVNGWSIGLWTIRWPQPPYGFTTTGTHSYPVYGETPLQLTNAWAGGGISVTTCLNPGHPLTSHHWPESGGTSNTYLVVGTMFVGGYGDSSIIPYSPSNRIIVPLQPGASDSVQISWRFGNTNNGDTCESLLADVYQQWSNRAPILLNWSNRAPMVAGFVASANYANLRNPDAYIAPNFTTDYTSRTGRLYLAEYMRTNVLPVGLSTLSNVNGQAYIIWDIEGYRRAWAKYNGTPWDVPWNMRDIFPAIVAQITNAGFRAGCLIRPQYAHQPFFVATESLRDNYNPADHFGVLSNSVQYARSIGCTVFYIDSTTTAATIMPYHILRRLFTAFPDCLFLPESQTPMSYTVSLPYEQLGLDGSGTPPSVSGIWSNANSVWKLVSNEASYIPQLITAVRRGDVLLVNDNANSTTESNVNYIYSQAYAP